MIMKDNKKDYSSRRKQLQEYAKQRDSIRNRISLYNNYAGSTLSTNVDDPYYDKEELIVSGVDDEKSSTPLLNRIGNAIGDFFTEDIPNALRMTAEKRAKGFEQEKREQLRRLNQENEALDLIKEYKDLLLELKSFDFLQNANYDDNRKRQIEDRIKQLDEYFKSDEGRSNPVISNLMYNINGDLDGYDRSMVANGLLVSGLNETPETTKGKNVWDTVKNSAGALWSQVENSFDALGNALTSGVNLISKGLSEIGIGDYDDGYLTAKAIQSLSSKDEQNSRWINHMYKGSDVISDSGLDKRYNDWREHNDRLGEQYTQELDKYIKDTREGNLKIPMSENAIDALKWFSPTKKYDPNTGLTINSVWDPEDVSKEWRQNQQNLSGSIWHPIYMLPEIGSTLGMIEGMIETIGVNAASEAVIRKLPSLIMGGEYKAALNAAISAGDAAKIKQLLDASSKIQTGKALGATTAAIRSLEVGSAIGITTAQRVHETNQEAIDAVSSRLQKNLQNSSADAQKVYNAILAYEQEHGVDISMLEPGELIGEAVARNIDTGDPVFEQQKKDAQNGVMKLINANNALALHDYLETLPFLSYGEKILSYFGKLKSGALTDFVPNFSRVSAADQGRRNITRLWKDMRTNAANAQELRAREALNPRLGEYRRAMLASYDGAVDDVAKGMIRNNKLFRGLATERIADYVGSKFKLLPYTMTMEGFEEGIQTTLQQRFERGEYDGYRSGYDQFSINEVLNTPELANHVFEALFGIHGAEDDEIVKATVIGAFVGSLFPIAGNALTNFSNNPNNQNIRNLVTQLKNDQTMSRLISDKFENVGDEKKIRLFTEALHRTGVDASRLSKSLYDIKSAVDMENGLVNPEMIDRDLQLLRATDYMYNNKYINDQLKKRGIERFSQQHKDIILDGATAIADKQMSRKNVNDAAKRIVEILQPNDSFIDEIFDPNTTEERKQEIYAENPELKQDIDKILNSYNDYQNAIVEENKNRQLQNEKARAKTYMKYIRFTPEQLADLTIRGRKEGLSFAERWLIQSGEIDRNSTYTEDYLRRKAIEIFSNKSFKVSFIRELQATQSYLEQLTPQDKNEYIKNYVSALNIFKQRKIAESLLPVFLNQQEVLKLVQSMTGLDLDTNKIRGIVDGLKDFISEVKKQESEYLRTENEQIQRDNKARVEAGEKELPLKTLDDVFKDNLSDLKFDKESDYAKAVKDYIINAALHFAQKKVADAYIRPEDVTPEELNIAIFGRDATNTLLTENVNAYKLKQAEMQARPEADTREDADLVDKEDLRVIREESSWKVIKNNLNHRTAERNRIVTRAFEEEQPEEQQEEQPQDQQQTNAGGPAVEEQPADNAEEEMQRDDDLEKALQNADKNAEAVEEYTMHLSPQEKARRERMRKRMQQKQEQDRKEEERASGKQDDRDPHSQDRQGGENVNKGERPAKPKVVIKPSIPDANSTIGDAIGEPIAIGGEYYYKYPVTTYLNGNTSTKFVIADTDGKVIENSPYAFVTEVPEGYKTDLSNLSEDEIQDISDGVSQVEITEIAKRADGKAAVRTNFGILPLIKLENAEEPVDTKVAETIDNAEHNGLVMPYFRKTNDTVVVRVETVVTLSNGDILGKIEEDGQVYYYIVRSTNDDENNSRSFEIEKYDRQGHKMSRDNMSVEVDNTWQTDGPDGVPGSVNKIEIQYTEQTNTPVGITVSGFGFRQEYVKGGVEVIGDPNTKPNPDEQVGDTPRLDEDDFEDANRSIDDQQMQEAADEQSIQDKIDEIENQKLEDEQAELDLIETVENEKINVSRISEMAADESGKISIGGLILDDVLQQHLEDQVNQLFDLEFLGDIDQIDLPNSKKSKKDAQARDEAYDYVSSTFFYKPDATEPMKLRIGGKDIKLPYKLGTGRQFAQRLIEKGWLEECYKNGKVYYVVTQSEDAAYKKNGRTAEQDRDTFTVTLIVQDDENKCCYASSLRQLGKYVSLGYDVNPVTGERRKDTEGRDIRKEFAVNRERELRDKLARIHTVYKRGTTRQQTYENERLGVAYTYYETLYGSRPQMPPENAPIEEQEAYERDYRNWVKRVKEWLSEGYKLPRTKGESEQSYKARVAQREETIQRINERARYNMRQIGKTPLTDAQIDEMIDNLRKVRNEIIDAYLAKDESGNYIWPSADNTRTDIIPAVVTRSNGRFNNQKTEGGSPILTNVTREGNPFGAKSGVSEVNQQIQNGEIKIGIGSGDVRSNNADTITDFRDGNESTVYPGKGLAGKVFIIVDSVNNTPVPVMLSEVKFNKQYGSDEIPTMIGSQNDSLKLCIDPFSGNITDTSVKPSAAEVILYLLFGKLNKSLLPLNNEGTQQQFASLFVNNGEDTLLNDSNVEAILPYYAAKQLSVINGNLIIGIPIGNGQYRQRSYSEASIFDTTEAAQKNRLEIVRAIAAQMHWNTEKQTMNEKFGGKMTANIATELEAWFNANPEEDVFTLANVPEFQFNKNDLFEIDKRTGKVLRIKRNMSMAAWMLCTGKLLTDVGDTVLKDPFVFADGIKITPKAKLKTDAEAAGAVLKTGDIDVDKTQAHKVIILNDPQKQLSVRQRIRTAANPNSPAAKSIFHDEQEYIDAMIESERTINSAMTQKHGPAVRVIALDLPNLAGQKNLTIEQLKQVVKDKIDDLVKGINPESIKAKKLNTDDDTFSSVTDDNYRQLMTARDQGWLLTARIFEDGYIKLYPQRYIGGAARPQKGSPFIINGVYQTRKTGGDFNEPAVRKWLHEKLGFDDSQVFVANAMLRGTENKEVFGVTNIAFDVVTNTIVGNMILRNSGGMGIHYHEAWHYINLLLHSPNQRIALYREYLATHKELKGHTYGEIEEAMAEDFRMWAERENATTFTGKINKYFHRVLDMLIASRRKSQYYEVFKAIQSGQYKNKVHRLDSRSVKEFVKKYPKGVHMLKISGIPQSVTAKMTNITNPVEFYEASDAILDYIFDTAELNTPEDALALSGKKFGDVLRQLKDYAEQLDPSTAAMVMDFYNNPAALQRRLFERFSALGIVVKEKKLNRKKEVDESATTKEDAPDNIWDRFQFTVSKKDNVSFRAKLFLRQIPQAKFVSVDYQTDYGKKDLEYEYNQILPGINKYTLFDVAWNQITSVANKCTSYGVMDENGNYPDNSFRGIVKRAAKASWFFAALDQKLDEIENDFDLKTQIYTAVNSQKPNILFHEIQAARGVASLFSAEDLQEMDEESIQQLQQKARENSLADRLKQWVLRNDNTLQAARNIPRRWSDSALLSGIVDLKEGNQKINEQFVNDATEIQADIKSIYNRDIKRNKNWESTYYEMSERVVDLCNHFGIIMDTDVIDYFVNLVTQSENFEDKSKVLLNSFTKNTTGTFGYIVAILRENVGQTQLIYKINNSDKIKTKTKLKEPKELNKLFSGTKLSSDITKLALAYHALHPSSSEFAVRGPNKEMLYPSSQNNFQSSKIRNLNTTAGQHALDMMRSPYAQHSIILNTARNFEETVSDDDQFHLNLNSGLKDTTSQDGADFFGITALEDYIQKLFLLDQDPEYRPAKSDPKKFSSNEATYLVDPTMADKKTNYSISSKSASFRTTHTPVIGVLRPGQIFDPEIIQFAEEMYGMDPVHLNGRDPEQLSRDSALKMVELWAKSNPKYGYRQFDSRTIDRFTGYFLDEINTLLQYYDKANIANLIKNPNKLRSNYHGKIKGGRMDFSGNGGKFRYFYDVVTDSNGMNMNQKLEWLYKLEKDILSGVKVGLQGKSITDLVRNASASDIDETAASKSDLDGFELIRKELLDMKARYFDKYDRATEELRDLLNQKLFRMIDRELYITATDSRFKLCEWNQSMGCYIPTAVPAQLLQRQNQRFLVNKKRGGSSSYIPYMNQTRDAIMFYSLMANHVVNTMTSVIEFEKVFSSDPAFYKWKDIKGQYSTELRKIKYTLPSGEVVEREYAVSNIDDKHSDKIKRLGSVQSPGDEMRLDLSDEEKSDPILNPDGYLNSNHYTVLVVDDVIAKSKFLKSIIEPKFKSNLIADYIRNNDIDEINQYIEYRRTKDAQYDKNRLINEIIDQKKIKFSDDVKDINRRSLKGSLEVEFEEYPFSFEDIQDKAQDELYSEYKKSGITVGEYIYNLLPRNIRKNIDANLEQQDGPYKKITVSDAQVFIRPAMYRKIRMSLGMWTTVEDSTGYSDEKAYNILENDASWQEDDEKAEIVRRFQLFPLKMSYVANEPEELVPGYWVNQGVLDKAAYFPLFKYTASNETGRQLYDRMNKEGNELDMIAFVSAVKVGAPKNIPMLYNTQDSDGKIVATEELGAANAILNNDSDTNVIYNIDSDSGEDINTKTGDNLLPVTVQDLSLLRYQLNTRAHESSERDLGTQAQKLAFSNIIDNAQYGRGKSDQQARSGRQIKLDVISCIKTLTQFESDKLDSEYFRNGRVNRGKVHDWMSRVTKTNGLGANAEDIMSNGVAESLSSRIFFEQTISSAVNNAVVDTNLFGGTAVQQSAIGFNDFDSRTAISDEDLERRNNFLKSEASIVLDLDARQEKQLEKAGITTLEDFVNSNSSLLKDKDIQDKLEYIGVHVGDKIVEGFHKINGGKEIKWHANENSMQVILSMNFFKHVIPENVWKLGYNARRKYLLDNNIIGEKAKPFGIGYRIPTQGMSSIFAFQVADVLPEQSGDLIVVPREFTAQTGSDFDVDKLYLATFAFEDALETVNGQEVKVRRKAEIKNKDGARKAETQNQLLKIYAKESEEAIQNQLLQDFIDVISDDHNYAESRASIDVITDQIHDNLLSWLRTGNTSYVEGMYELLPSFQLLRKQEFKVGKDGIGPFALNATNVSLVQLVGLTLDYGENPYGFGDLYEIDGQDGNRIGAWLSAMINAHVDVAKDPYVFVLNVNKATYNYANFLIRAGKGISTFTFLTQPILVEYANRVLNSGGLYGKNLDGKNTMNKSFSQVKKEIVKSLMLSYLERAKNIKKTIPSSYWDEHKEELQSINQLITSVEYKFQFTRAQQDAYQQSHEGKAPSMQFTKDKIFDYETAKRQILELRNPSSQIAELRASIYQLCVMQSFQDIEPYANAISELVTMSQIDTKKFGNNIAAMRNFGVKLNKFIYSPKAPWKLKDQKTDPGVVEPTAIIALETYFKESFLLDKYKKACYYTKKLASGELLTGSNEFDEVFDQIATEVNGSTIYKKPAFILDKTTNKYVPYYVANKQGVKIRQMEEFTTFAPFSSDEVVQELSGAVDNLMRFNILMNLGQRALNNGMLALPSEGIPADDFSEDGPIDFTFGGDYVEVLRNISRLLYGTETEPSLPIRVKNFISEVLNDPYGEKAVGIVEDGKIVNEFLLYLSPIAATKEIPVDRLNLNESAIRTSKEKKPVLTAYWNELLTHQNADVRKLARDIAIYAYYNTYDTNSVNNIVDLIPPYFRSQYDNAVKQAVRQENGVKLRDVLGNFLNMSQSQQLVERYGLGLLYYDIIARNYWYDDNIVHRVPEHGRGIMNVKSDYVEYRSDYITDSKSGQRFAGLIATTNYIGNPLFVKIVKGDGSMLYRRVGRLEKRNKKGNDKLGAAVYMAVQKAGMHVGKTHIYEFFKSQFIPSLFQWNMLPAQYNHTLLRKSLLKSIEQWNKQAQGFKFVYIPETEIEIPEQNREQYDKYVYKEAPIVKQKNLFGGDVLIDVRKNPVDDARKLSSYIIKFGNKTKETDSPKGFENKTIYINTGNIDALQNLISQLQQMKIDPSAGTAPYLEMDESAFKPTKEEVEYYLEEAINRSIDESTLEPDQVEQYRIRLREQYKDYAEEYAKVQKMADAANIVIQTMLTNGYSLQRLYAAGLNNSTRAAMNAYEHNKESFSLAMSYMFVGKEDYKSDAYDQFLDLMSEEMHVQDLYVEDSAVAEENQNLEEQAEQQEEESQPADMFASFEDDEAEFDDDIVQQARQSEALKEAEQSKKNNEHQSHEDC